jgi:regulatory protein
VKPRRGPIEDQTASGRSLEPSDISESRADKGATKDLDRMREKVTAAAFKILAARPRSERQLREKLLAKPWVEPEAVDQCIARLKELGYVNDALFARNYASSRVGLKAVGRARVARELAGRKVSRDTIEEAVGSVFNEAGEETLIDRAIEKRLRTHGRPSDRGSVKRMFDHLARLGFEYSLIVRKLQALKANIGDDDQ